VLPRVAVLVCTASFSPLWNLAGQVAPSERDSLPHEVDRVVLASVAGIGAGSVGLLLGAWLSNPTFVDCDDRLAGGCGRMILGAGIGEVMGLSLGVHFANRRRGRFAADLATSVVVGVGMSLLAGGLNQPEILLPIGAAVQVATTAVTEVLTGR